MTNSNQPKKPRHPDPTEVDPVKRDALLKRMLQTKPKPHKEMQAERQSKQGARQEPKRK